MTCAEFDAALSEILAVPDGNGDGRLSSLRAHAASCPVCVSASDLVELAARPVSERDPVDDPGEAYWREFGARVSARLAREGAAPKRHLAVGGGLAAAAIVVVGLLVGVLRRAPVAPPEAPVEASARVEAPKPPFRSETRNERIPSDDGPVVDEDLADGFTGAEPIDAFSEDDPGGLYPAVDQLAPEDAERFLEWLRREESRVRKGAA